MDSKTLLFTLLLLATGFAQAQEKKDQPLNLFGGDSKAKGPTIITATQEATFDSKAHTAVFTGNVQVQDPQFSLVCDKLTVFLNKEEGGMREANAEGNVFIVSISKSKSGGPDEKSTGKGERAVYTTADGLIVLSGSPQIQQGGNTHIATEPGTKMFLYRDGRLNTEGSSRTIIQNKPKDSKESPKSNAPQ